MATVYMFPGQGSQICGMGADVFPLYPHLVRQADQVVGFSIERLCLEDPEQVLDQTEFTQVALYVVNTLLYLEQIRETGKEPDWVVGHSIGEFNALFAAGVFDFLTGLELVTQRAALMAQIQGGTMAAVMGLSGATVAEILAEASLEDIDLAGWNAPQQVVIAGSVTAMAQATSVLLAQGALQVIPLRVSGAFHSRALQPAAEEFASLLEEYQLAAPQIPVLANYTARPYQASQLKDTLSQQLCHTVRWLETIHYLLQQDPNSDFIEVSSRPVLTRLVEQIRADIPNRSFSA